MKIYLLVMLTVIMVLGGVLWLYVPKSCQVISFRVMPDISHTYSTRMAKDSIQSGPNMVARGVDKIYYKIADGYIKIYVDSKEIIVPLSGLNMVEK